MTHNWLALFKRYHPMSFIFRVHIQNIVNFSLSLSRIDFHSFANGILQAEHHMILFEFSRGKSLFTLCTPFDLFAGSPGRSDQLVGRQSDPGICLQTVYQEHVLVVLEVIFEISIATVVVVPIAYAQMFVEFLRVEESRKTRGTFKILGIPVVFGVLGQFEGRCECFEAYFARKVSLNL